LAVKRRRTRLPVPSARRNEEDGNTEMTEPVWRFWRVAGISG
jgi:hypothetical protein